MKRKLLSILCATSLIGTLLVGCGSGSASKDKTVVTVMQSKVEIQEQLEEAAKAFNKSQDEIEVKILGVSGSDYDTNLQAQFASSPEKAPTIFTAQGGAELERFQKFMAPIKDSKAAGQIAEGLEEGATVDGELLGLPTTVEGIGLIYNKKILDEAGVKPEELNSMESLMAACEKLAKVEGVESPIGFAKESYFSFMHPFNWPFAVMDDYKTEIDKVNNGEKTLKDIETVNKFVKDLNSLSNYTNKAKATYDEQIAKFSTGKYAMIHQGNWAQNVMNDYNIDFEYGMLPLPVEGTNKLAVDVSNYYCINNSAKEEEQKAAITFLDWLITSEEGKNYYVNEFKFIPAYKDMDTSNLDKLAQDVAKYTEEGNTVPWAFTYFPSGAHQEFANTLEKYYAGQINSDQLLDELNALWLKK